MRSGSHAAVDSGVPFGAAAAYRHFVAGVFSRVAERPLFEVLPPELELQSLWFAGAFGRCFRSTRGEAVEIVQFGHWNHSAGPDFQDAVVSVDGVKRRGTIELDTDVRDWERHRHGSNPAYDGVVLHLFFEAPGGTEHFTRNSKHAEIVQVRLGLDLLDAGAVRHPWEAEAHLGRCATPLESMSGERIESLLRSAAQYRLEQKAIQSRRLEEIHGRDQAIYQGIAQALGYRPNSFPMVVLAQRAPLAMIRKADPAEREAILFGIAGFLEQRAPDEAPEETRKYLASLWDWWWKRRGEFGAAAERLPAWKFAGVRPGNHPHRRIAALARIVDGWKELARITGGAGSFSEKAFRGFCAELSHPYWERHFTLRADPTGGPLALIGRSRVIEILANQIYPLLMGIGSARSPALWEEYEKLTAVLGNEKIRRASIRLFGNHPGRKKYLRKVFQQQALLQIYADFCLEDDSDCVACPFPEQLKQWP